MQPECCCLSVRLSRHINKTELHLAKHCPAWFRMFMQHQAITILLIYSFYRSAKILLGCQFRLFPLEFKDLWPKITGFLTLHFPTDFDSGSSPFFFLMHLKHFQMDDIWRYRAVPNSFQVQIANYNVTEGWINSLLTLELIKWWPKVGGSLSVSLPWLRWLPC